MRDTQIESPHQLTTLLREIKGALADGRLEQFAPAAAAQALDDLNTVSDAGPWPDYLEAYFRNPSTGEQYRLTVETQYSSDGCMSTPWQQ